MVASLEHILLWAKYWLISEQRSWGLYLHAIFLYASQSTFEMIKKGKNTDNKYTSHIIYYKDCYMNVTE